MTTILLILHVMVTLVMIILILLQRSEGGGLGIGGGGGGMGSFATPRSTANALTKATMFCFVMFVTLSLILAVMAGNRHGTSIIDKLDQSAPVSAAPVDPAAAVADTPVKPDQSAPPPASSPKAGAPAVPLSK